MADIRECLKARITRYSHLVTHNPHDAIHNPHVTVLLYMKHARCCNTQMDDEVSSHIQVTLLRMFVYHLAASLPIFEVETSCHIISIRVRVSGVWQKTSLYIWGYIVVVVLVVVPNICTERTESSQPWFPVRQGRVCSAVATMHVTVPLSTLMFW